TTDQRSAGSGESWRWPRATANGLPFTSSTASVGVSFRMRYQAPLRSAHFTSALRRAHWNALGMGTSLARMAVRWRVTARPSTPFSPAAGLTGTYSTETAHANLRPVHPASRHDHAGHARDSAVRPDGLQPAAGERSAQRRLPHDQRQRE